VNSVAFVQGTTTDGDVSGSYRYTRVYVRDAQDKWKIVSFEASRIRQPGERKKPASFDKGLTNTSNPTRRLFKSSSAT